MDFKTKRKIITMKRKFEHDDLILVGGLLAIIGLIAFNIVTHGVSANYHFAF